MSNKLSAVLINRLNLIFKWYLGMVNERTGRLHYMYYPKFSIFSDAGSPIREIASVWEMEMLGSLLNRKDLKPVIDKILQYYIGFCIEGNGYVILNPEQLWEPSSIAHSAFMILSLLYSQIPDGKARAILMAEGILRNQRNNGSYKIYFGDEPDTGLEFYPGEAMLSLMELHGKTSDYKYMKSVESGFHYYSSQYFEKGLGEEIPVFFANWQSQFCRLLFQYAESDYLREGIRRYVFELHDRIIENDFYIDIQIHPARQSSVEVACAAEGLNDAYSIAAGGHEEQRMERYRESLCIALSYLLDVQCTEHCAQMEEGGFGFSLSERTQRVDVTGHVVSAFVKSLRNAITCE